MPDESVQTSYFCFSFLGGAKACIKKNKSICMLHVITVMAKMCRQRVCFLFILFIIFYRLPCFSKSDPSNNL